MKKNIFSILILYSLITSCSPFRMLKTVTQGEVEQKNYFEEISFFYHNNIIVLEVIIDGQAYNFIFDTGNDLTSIDSSLISKINSTSNKVNGKILDAKNIKSNNEFISIDNIQIGNIKFSNIGAQVFDHSPFEQIFGCELKISGLIGSNLMRKAIWQIDYESRKIRFADKIEAFDLTDNFKFKTNSGRYGSAKIEIKLNDFSADYTFDTGSSGFISTNLKTLDNLNSKKGIQNTKALITSFSASGKSINETIYGYVENIDIGEINIKNQTVRFNKNHSNLVGNRFFKNYLITLDWSGKAFYLKPIKEIVKSQFSKYEYTFAPNYKTNEISFYNQWEDHNLVNPFELNSTIVSINGIRVDKLTNEQLCFIWKNQKSKMLTKNVEIEIIENGIKRKIQLIKKQLLPK